MVPFKKAKLKEVFEFIESLCNSRLRNVKSS